MPRKNAKGAVWAKPKAADIGKTMVHLRLDDDLVAWFKHQGTNFGTRINAILRAYVEAQTP